MARSACRVTAETSEDVRSTPQLNPGAPMNGRREAAELSDWRADENRRFESSAEEGFVQRLEDARARRARIAEGDRSSIRAQFAESAGVMPVRWNNRVSLVARASTLPGSSSATVDPARS
jgi:hypothetical protein